jgi:hypothetical protein
MTNETLLLRAQVRIHQVGKMQLYLAGPSRKLVSIAASFEGNKIIAVQRLSHFTLFTH